MVHMPIISDTQEVGGSKFKSSPGKSLAKPYLKNKLVYIPEILATQEAEVGESLSKANLGKSTRPYLENKLKQKGWGHGSRGRVLGFGSNPMPPKKTKTKRAFLDE
jgi:hypothetical protein